MGVVGGVGCLLRSIRQRMWGCQQKGVHLVSFFIYWSAWKSHPEKRTKHYKLLYMTRSRGTHGFFTRAWKSLSFPFSFFFPPVFPSLLLWTGNHYGCCKIFSSISNGVDGSTVALSFGSQWFFPSLINT